MKGYTYTDDTDIEAMEEVADLTVIAFGVEVLPKSGSTIVKGEEFLHY